MSSLSGFNNWAEIADYIDNTLGISYTENPTGWVDALKEEMKGYRFVHLYDDFSGKVTEQIWAEDLVVGTGEIHYDSRFPNGENVNNWYNGKVSGSTGGTGYKSVPTAKSIITNNSGGGTAVITEEATGVKDTGLVNGVTGINIINGLLQIYGLVHTGIKIVNAQVWKDMANYVYDSDFTEDTPVERVIEFVTTKIVNTVTDLTSDGDIRVSIPDSIAQKMYEFLSNHMILDQTPAIYPACVGMSISYNYIERSLELANPNVYTLERYRSTTNPTNESILAMVDISDDFFKVCVLDFIEQAIGVGYTIAASVGTALAASMEGIWQYLKQQSIDAVENADTCDVEIKISRGSGTPTSTPISLAEITIAIFCNHDTTIETVELEGTKYATINQNIKPGADGYPGFPALAAGSSYQEGDCVKYLKRGKTGDNDNDYGYLVALKRDEYTSGSVREQWNVGISYPSNEQVLSYSHKSNGENNANGPIKTVNGYCPPAYYASGADYSDTFTDSIIGSSRVYFARGYSNVGYRGYGESYQPDDYLVTAGFRSKIDSSGNPEKHPNPNQTKEERYPEMENKKQQANPQVTDGDEPTVENSIKEYVPVPVPFGSKNAKRSIEHGLNNPDDPESYQDDRPQDIKLQGRVNTDDPIDGYNEDTGNVIKEYNQSENDPFNYPEPSPTPLPDYPVDLPTDPSGETEDAPTPAALPGVTASGMVSVYNPTKQQVIDFSGWLWTNNVIENLKKILANPMDAIIGMHIMYATPVTGSAENIICGYLDSGVAAKVVTQQYIEISCGSVIVPEYYGDVLDYEPYTQIHIYLPFIGICTLKANDVVGRKVTVKYGIDVLTGTVLAMINCEWGESDIQSYTFPGNCAVQIPLTGGNYAEVIKSIASMTVGVAGSLVSGNPLPAIGGAIGGAMGMSLDVSKSGSLGANAGVLGPRKPYIIITRKCAYDAANYNQFYGMPANKTVTLSNCTGYTRVKAVHIETIPVATDNEKTEIETLLKQGVVIR